MTTPTTPPTTPAPEPAKRKRRTAGSLASSMASAPPTEPTKTAPPAEEVPVAEPDQQPAPAPEPTEKAPQEAQDAPNVATEGNESSQAEKAPQASNEGREVAVIMPPVTQLPDLNLIQRRAATVLDPAQQALYTRSLELEFMQVTKSYRDMMDRQQQLTELVRLARAAGYPEAELEKLAVKHNWGVPETES